MRESFIDRSKIAAIAGFSALLVFGACASSSSSSTAHHAGSRPHVGSAVKLPPYVPGQVLVKFDGSHRTRTVNLRHGLSVHTAMKALRRSPKVAYAVPNFIATASSFPLPNDPGVLASASGAATKRGWVERQWNFLPCGSLCGGEAQPYESLGGIDAVSAWQHLRAAGHEGASGVRVAILDSGIAYRSAKGGYHRSPDFSARQFARGYDFVQSDTVPLDQNGHGTHVAGTIGEETGNGVGVTGLAYKAKLIPVRVLDSLGRGRADEIALGIRYAATHGADVINMSFNFPCAASVPDVTKAINFAHRKGAVLVASEGNAGSELCISSPATEPHVIAVGGTTDGACPGFYSLPGPALDLMAPGGGTAATNCVGLGKPIIQMTLRPGSVSKFGLPETYVGTSMAAAHVSGVAAMVIASGVLGPNPSPNSVARRLRLTARDLGAPGRDLVYGAGLIDAGAATAPDAPRTSTGAQVSGIGLAAGVPVALPPVHGARN